VPVSCVTGSGLDRLREEIRAFLTVRGVERPGLRFLLNLRQLDALRRSREAVARASAAAHDDIGLEFPAAEIRIALNNLRELTHPLTEDEILDRIFSRFCIGK
jgi:tRNA modification GTPase